MTATTLSAQDPDDQLTAAANLRIAPVLTGKRLTAFGGERGLWGKHAEPIEFEVSEAEVVYGDAESENGFVSLNIRLSGYQADQHGLIYTDSTFLASLKAVLAQAGMDGEALHYSEAGMQGDDYVNLDVSFYTLDPASRPEASRQPRHP